MIEWLDIVKVLLGFFLLIIGGDLLVKIAVRFAVRFHVPPAAIGLTIVAAGTSLPELVTSILAALNDNADISVGNVVGSNIFNILAGIGLASLIKPSKILKQALKIEWPFLMIVSLGMFGLAQNHMFERSEGIVMILSLVAFMWFSVKNARKIGLDIDDDEIPEHVDNNNLKDSALMVGGIICLVFGADIALDGAVSLGRAFGITDRVIGLTIISAGTGLPELATSAMAAYRGRNDIAFANILGSNIMNILAIVGITTFIKPLSISPSLIHYDMLVMLAATAILLPMMLKKSRHIMKWEGAILFIAYLSYLYSLI